MNYTKFERNEHHKNHYYVYIYLDPTRPGNFVYNEYTFLYEPFYVGKGQKNRAIVHIDECWRAVQEYNNPKKEKRIRDLLCEQKYPIILLIYENIIDEIEAYRLETKVIETIGIDSKLTGPLYNYKINNNISAPRKYPATRGKNTSTSQRQKFVKINEINNDQLSVEEFEKLPFNIRKTLIHPANIRKRTDHTATIIKPTIITKYNSIPDSTIINIFNMCENTEYTLKEIAQRFNIDVNAVWRIKNKSTTKIKDLLNNELPITKTDNNIDVQLPLFNDTDTYYQLPLFKDGQLRLIFKA